MEGVLVRDYGMMVIWSESAANCKRAWGKFVWILSKGAGYYIAPLRRWGPHVRREYTERRVDQR